MKTMATMKGVRRWWGVVGMALVLMVGLSGGSSRALAQGGLKVEWVGQIGGAAWAVAVEGRYAYVGAGPRLVVLDVTNPARPVEVGRTDVLPGVVGGVAVSWRYAYVADWWGGLRVIDVSDPARPREVGFYDTPGAALGVAVSGRYAYVADGGSGLRVIDVSNPALPREVGFYNTPGWAEGVAVLGPYAYVADGSGGLVILRFLGAEPTSGATYSISGQVAEGSSNPIASLSPRTPAIRPPRVSKEYSKEY